MSAEDPHQDDPRRPAPWIERLGRSSWAFVGVAAAATVLILVVVFLRDIVVPLLLAGFLAIVFAPGVDFLERRRVPRSIGAFVMIVLIVAVVAGAGAIVVAGVVDRVDELQVWFDQAQDELDKLIDRWGLQGFIDDLRSRTGDSGTFLTEGLGEHIGTFVGSAASFLSGLVLGFVLLYYMLKDGSKLAGTVARRRDPDDAAQAERILDQAAGSVRGHFKGRSILALIQGVAIALILWVMGVPLAGSIGVVNFIGAYIPYLGAFVGGAFAMLMALAGGGTSAAIAALLVVLFVNLVLENLLEPRLVGTTLKLHPVAVLLATVGGGMLAGLVGLVLGAPLAAISSNLFRELRATGFFGDPPEPVTKVSDPDVTGGGAEPDPE